MVGEVQGGNSGFLPLKMSLFGSIQTQFWSVRDYLAPVLRDSKFKESGRITPEEYVAAGDFLVYKFPTWSWEAGEPGKRRDFLPQDKQYLIQRNVPCLRRVSQLAYGGNEETLMSFADGGDGDDWVATHVSTGSTGITSSAPTIGDIPDADIDGKNADGKGEDMPDLDDIPDMEDDNLESGGLVEEEDEAVIAPVVASAGGDNLLQVRTYDCSITYDKYYQTPRMWLLGYDEHKNPLPPASALEDVSSDHAQKTVTIEPFPHSTLSMASVHPCKHSSVMKKVIERMDKGVVEAQRREREGREGRETKDTKEGKEKKWGLGKIVKKDSKDKKEKDDGDDLPEGLRVDQYLVVFLKFMSSIVPTIEVDATNSI